jgi:hypothetical protein
MNTKREIHIDNCIKLLFTGNPTDGSGHFETIVKASNNHSNSNVPIKKKNNNN